MILLFKWDDSRIQTPLSKRHRARYVFAHHESSRDLLLRAIYRQPVYAPSAVIAQGYTRKFRFLPEAPGYVMVSECYRVFCYQSFPVFPSLLRGINAIFQHNRSYIYVCNILSPFNLVTSYFGLLFTSSDKILQPTAVKDPKSLVELYRNGAINAKKAGFDGVEREYYRFTLHIMRTNILFFGKSTEVMAISFINSLTPRPINAQTHMEALWLTALGLP